MNTEVIESTTSGFRGTTTFASPALEGRNPERIACLLVRSRAAIFELAEACYRFSPQIAVRAPEPTGLLGDRTCFGAVFIEIGKCRTLYTEESLLLRLGLLSQRFGCMARISFADDVPTALTQARFGANKREKLPLEALHDFASPFGYDEQVFKKISRLIGTMRMLGLESVGDFARLPTKTLASRFGSEGVELSLSLLKRTQLAWPRFQPPEKVIEKAELHELSEFPICRDIEPLLFVLKSIGDRVMARLRGRAQRLSTLELTLELEKGKREWRLDLPVPQGSVSGLLPILREKLDRDLQRTPLEHAIVRVIMKVSETAPAHRAQRDLFSASDDINEAWDSLVGRLCQKLGKDKAFVAHTVDEHLPERAWARALEALDRLPIDIPPRPARVLKKPLLLKQEGHFLTAVPVGPGRGISTKIRITRRWRTVEWSGPERIAVEWWMDPQLEGFKRDYFQVNTESGERLWVFTVPSKPGDFFLHGYFD